MTSGIKTCDRPCSCAAISHEAEFVVLTGGPGAGKTAVLELVAKVLCEHVIVLPEAASILFGGGFLRLDSSSAKKAAQRAIYHVQAETETLVLEEKKWSMALCDRGTLDGLAYWPGDESEFFSVLNTNREKEFLKYRAVIHLSAPTIESGYDFRNPVRIESAAAAAKIDTKLRDIWRTHPNYQVIESTFDFMEKIKQAVILIQSLVPKCCKEHLEGVERWGIA